MIFIVRHGQTDTNRKGLLQGRSDLSLNEAGRAQAEETARKLADRGVVFDRVFSSPLVRARQTAEILAPGVPVTADPRLIEMDLGPYEGMELKKLPPEVTAFFRDFVHVPAPEGMEPLSEVEKRAGEFMESVRDLRGNVLITTHAVAMKGLLEYLTPGSEGAYWSKFIGNCAVYVLSVENGAFTVPEELVL